MGLYLAIALGGAAGCLARYGLTDFIQTFTGKGFPAATLLINILGSFLMGLMFILMLERLTLPPAVRAGLLAGLLGGFTTFSTFSMEVFLLTEQGELAKAAAYVLASVVLGIAAAFVGVYVGRSFV